MNWLGPKWRAYTHPIDFSRSDLIAIELERNRLCICKHRVYNPISTECKSTCLHHNRTCLRSGTKANSCPSSIIDLLLTKISVFSTNDWRWNASFGHSFDIRQIEIISFDSCSKTWKDCCRCFAFHFPDMIGFCRDPQWIIEIRTICQLGGRVGSFTSFKLPPRPNSGARDDDFQRD